MRSASGCFGGGKRYDYADWLMWTEEAEETITLVSVGGVTGSEKIIDNTAARS